MVRCAHTIYPYSFHLVDDSFLMLKTFYLLDASSATRFFISFDGESGSRTLGTNVPSLIPLKKRLTSLSVHVKVYTVL